MSAVLEPSASVQLPARSSRLNQLPVYVFAWLDELKEAARARGADLIDLGMGNPDQPTPAPIVEAIREAVGQSANHGYPAFKGKPAFRQAVVDWMARRYGVTDLDPNTEVQPLIGSKEGLAHLTFAYVEPGVVSLVPAPYYPVHARATWLAGGEPYFLPMTPENGFRPQLDQIPADVLKRSKLFFISYPNNPTSATVPDGFYEELVAFARQHGLIIVSDLAYGEIGFDGYQPPSIFSVPGAKDVAVEFHSFSKSFNMAGWRVAFAVGNAEVIKSLYSLKTNLDYGVSSSIQEGGIRALTDAETLLPSIVATYQQRRDVAVEGFRSLGWEVEPTRGSMYLWLRVPAGYDSRQWTQYLIEKTGVVVAPGMAFGDVGEGFFRISLILPEARLKEAIQRLADQGIRYQAG